jgi:DNA-directed RNA polymerase subunit RPC12/RpoP
MTTLLSPRRIGLVSHPQSLFEEPGGEPTLDELLVGVWEGLTAGSAVECPVCGAQMGPAEAPGAESSAGRCPRCGSTLS